MTIREIITTGNKEFVSASCTRCFRKQKQVFHMRIDNPSPEDIERVRYRAVKHDGRKANHPIVLYINYRAK